MQQRSPAVTKDVFEKAVGFTKAEEFRRAGLYPYFIPLSSSTGPEVTIEGRRLIMLGSNNYLGLTQHPKVQEAAVKAVARGILARGRVRLWTRVEIGVKISEP